MTSLIANPSSYGHTHADLTNLQLEASYQQPSMLQDSVPRRKLGTSYMKAPVLEDPPTNQQLQNFHQNRVKSASVPSISATNGRSQQKQLRHQSLGFRSSMPPSKESYPRREPSILIRNSLHELQDYSQLDRQRANFLRERKKSSPGELLSRRDQEESKAKAADLIKSKSDVLLRLSDKDYPFDYHLDNREQEKEAGDNMKTKEGLGKGENEERSTRKSSSRLRRTSSGLRRSISCSRPPTAVSVASERRTSSSWDLLDDYLSHLGDTLPAQRKVPLASGSNEFSKVLRDMKEEQGGNELQSGNNKGTMTFKTSLANLQSGVNQHPRTRRVSRQMQQTGSKLRTEVVQDTIAEDLTGEGSERKKQEGTVGTARGWSILKRHVKQMAEKRKEKEQTKESKNWTFLLGSLKVLTKMERERRALYERYLPKEERALWWAEGLALERRPLFVFNDSYKARCIERRLDKRPKSGAAVLTSALNDTAVARSKDSKQPTVMRSTTDISNLGTLGRIAVRPKSSFV